MEACEADIGSFETLNVRSRSLARRASAGGPVD